MVASAGFAALRDDRRGTVERVGGCEDRAIVFIENICCEKIRAVAVTGEATRLLRSSAANAKERNVKECPS